MLIEVQQLTDALTQHGLPLSTDAQAIASRTRLLFAGARYHSTRGALQSTESVWSLVARMASGKVQCQVSHNRLDVDRYPLCD